MLKVKFKLPSVKREAELLNYFLTSASAGWDWSSIIYRNHPELKKILKGKKPNDFYKRIRKYSAEFIKENKDHLNESVKEYQKEWDKINEEYFKILSEHLETKIPKERKTISAYVSISPIFPRFLDEWGFCIGFKNIRLVIPFSMHEVLHFFYFKKWMEVFPETKREELDFPHLVWRLSEILAPAILNYNKDIQKLCKFRHEYYPEFQKVKIGKKKMIKHFEDLYKKHLKDRESFEEFLKNCRNETLKYKEIIGKI